ncbi:MAG: hypothetical protein EOP09_01150 [Proteobacteria bacterium]|nr:MAG: hypothetical protein EOP09_01150 [Pseudomonadota bacterium]
MKKRNLILALTASIILQNVATAAPHALKLFEGSKGGGGGKIVQCPDFYNTNEEYQVLDFSRMQLEFDLQPIHKIEGDGSLAKAIAIVNRIKRFNQKRADHYTKDLINFWSEVTFVGDSAFPITRDTEEVTYCKNGKIMQVITQLTPSTPYQKRYKVNKERFKLLSEFQQAVLLVHEVILKETKAQGIEGADSAVTLNTFLISEQLRYATRDQYAAVLQGAGLFYRDLTVQGIALPTEAPYFQQYNTPKAQLGSGFNSVIVPALSTDLIQNNCESRPFFYHFPLIGRVQTHPTFTQDDCESLAAKANQSIRAQNRVQFLSASANSKTELSFTNEIAR